VNWDCLDEAAHAFCARHFGYPVYWCDQDGVHVGRLDKYTESQVGERLIILAAGGVAASVYYDMRDTDEQDHLQAIEFLKEQGATDLLAPVCDAGVVARKLIRANITAIRAVARALFENGRLTQSEIDAAVVAAT
jgi:hypothetical protein